MDQKIFLLIIWTYSQWEGTLNCESYLIPCGTCHNLQLPPEIWFFICTTTMEKISYHGYDKLDYYKSDIFAN